LLQRARDRAKLRAIWNIQVENRAPGRKRTPLLVNADEGLLRDIAGVLLVLGVAVQKTAERRLPPIHQIVECQIITSGERAHEVFVGVGRHARRENVRASPGCSRVIASRMARGGHAGNAGGPSDPIATPFRGIHFPGDVLQMQQGCPIARASNALPFLLRGSIGGRGLGAGLFEFAMRFAWPWMRVQ